MMLDWLYKIGCFASVANPIKKYSLVLGVTIIIGNFCNSIVFFFLTYLNIDFGLFGVIVVLLLVNTLLYVLLQNYLSENYYNQLIEDRKKINNKQNLKYQLILLIILIISALSIFAGMIMGSEYR
jgi:ABC-type Fe3+ transport system permease subunit